jgi:hypothetical protein
MADNISITVSDINDLKNSRDTAIARLNVPNYQYAQVGTSKAADKQLPIVGDTGGSVKMYTGLSPNVSLPKSGKTATTTFNMTTLNFAVPPILSITVGADKDLTPHNINYNAVYNSKTNSVTVYISQAKTSSGSDISVNVHLIAIGYA